MQGFAWQVCQAFYPFFTTGFIKSILQEHKCYIQFIMTLKIHEITFLVDQAQAFVIYTLYNWKFLLVFIFAENPCEVAKSLCRLLM